MIPIRFHRDGDAGHIVAFVPRAGDDAPASRAAAAVCVWDSGRISIEAIDREMVIQRQGDPRGYGLITLAENSPEQRS